MEPVVYLGAVLVVAALGQWFAWAIKVPSILALLVLGFAGGLVVSPDEVLGRDVLFAGVSLAVGIILFEGSMSLRLADVRDLGRPVIRLCSLTVLIAWALITVAGWAVGLDLQLALLVGAILVVTGPTVINPILRQLRPNRRVSSLLRWEGIVVDPIGAILAVLVYQAVLVGNREDAFGTALITLAASAGIAVALSGLLAVLLTQVMRRHLVPDYLHGTLFLAVAAGALVASNIIQSESGLLTVTVLGIVLGNVPGLHLEHVQEFYEHLQVLLVGVLFVILAGRVSPSQVVDVMPMALLFVLLLMVVVRPVSIWVGLLGTDTTRQERTLLSGMAPRGIVAAAVTSIFALELEHAAEQVGGSRSEALRQLAQEAEAMVPIVFVTIVVTVAVYGLGVGRLAERLGLATPNPHGVVFAGAQEWVRQAAKVLGELEVPTVLVSEDASQLSRARMAGVRTERTNILSEYAVSHLDLAGIGTFIAATPDDGTNTTASREFIHTLGRANVFQLRRADSEPSAPKEPPRLAATGRGTATVDRVATTDRGTATTDRAATMDRAATTDRGTATVDRAATMDRLSARAPFRPPLTHEQMEGLVHQGMTVRRTELTDSFTVEDYLERNPKAVLLFTHDGTRAAVITEDTTLPEQGVSLIALAPPRQPSG